MPIYCFLQRSVAKIMIIFRATPHQNPNHLGSCWGVSSAKAPVGLYAVSFSSEPVVVTGNFQKTKKDAASIPHAIRNTIREADDYLTNKILNNLNFYATVRKILGQKGKSLCISNLIPKPK